MSQLGRDFWLQARALNKDPKGEWTFPLFLCRARVSQPDGLDFCYEHLSSWEQLTTLVKFVETLAQHGITPHNVYSVTVGIDIFDEAYYAHKGRLSLPVPGEPYRGRHAVSIVGMEDDKNIVFANSWGDTRWGDGGYGYISRAYFEKHVDLVLASRPALFGSSIALDKELKRRSWMAGRPGSVFMEDISAAWYTPNRPRGKSVTLHNQPHDLARRTLFTFDGEPFEITELRLNDSMVGRMHVMHSSRESVVTELWVPPGARRQGYGTLLLEVAEDLARAKGSERMLLLGYEADESHVDAACSFAKNYDYTTTSSSLKRPNLVAVARKTLTAS